MNEIQEYIDGLTVYGCDPCADCGHSRSDHSGGGIACDGRDEIASGVFELCQCVIYKTPAPVRRRVDWAKVPERMSPNEYGKGLPGDEW